MGIGKGERLKTCERPEDLDCGKQALLLCPADFGPYITFIILYNSLFWFHPRKKFAPRFMFH